MRITPTDAMLLVAVTGIAWVLMRWMVLFWLGVVIGIPLLITGLKNAILRICTEHYRLYDWAGEIVVTIIFTLLGLVAYLVLEFTKDMLS